MNTLKKWVVKTAHGPAGYSGYVENYYLVPFVIHRAKS